MVFLAVACLLTAIAVLVVAAPLWRAPKQIADSLAYDREIYRARLEEIDADLAFGRLEAAEAEAARAEEGRKLLASSERHPASPVRHEGHTRAAIFSALLFIPIMAGWFYWAEGQPQMSDMAIATRPDRDLSAQSMEQLLDRAEARLANEPGDLRGWLVVAPVYLRMGRTEDAITAFRNAVRLSPDDAGLKSSLGEAIVVGAKGVVTEEARDLFEQTLAGNPGAAKPRFYLAIALGQQGDWEEAIDAWRKLIGEAPQEAPWLEAARAQLAAAEEKAGVRVADDENVANGPSAADIEAAGRMSEEDRGAMIEAMVSGLADRLADNPDDKQGWRRLIRSYSVMGAHDKARAAIEDARGHFAGDEMFAAELDRMAQSLEKGRESQ